MQLPLRSSSKAAPASLHQHIFGAPRPLKVLWMLSGSIASGSFAGCKTTGILRVLWSFSQPQTSSEVLYILSSVYLTNGLAESMRLSGIIACLCSVAW